ncbi:hypothetical protein FA15DRAFT_597697 [Coprinopsis marcescibilis]|uniref:F-box domain-containing protein n=1 Tax=Coprinopsis marcescibilis TaxID=230819 RepID=A0A5C3KMF6_COPMA|nr:hypothetical protein FA15DRAFT_597697 [Coprinopsis marcescibilis]
MDSLPLPLLEEIAFHLVTGEPADLLRSLGYLPPLLRLSKSVSARLSPSSATNLYARLCRFFLDTAAVSRRWWSTAREPATGGPTRSAYTAHLMNRIQRLFGDPALPDHLMTTYLLLLENDGRNLRVLQDVQAYTWVRFLVLKRLWEGREYNDGWPVENVLNTLSLWVLWMLTTDDELRQETDGNREMLVNLVLPFATVPYRYATAYAPPTHFTLPLPNVPIYQTPVSLGTAHGPFPVYYSQPFLDPYAPLTVYPPPLSAPAKLLFLSRRELTSWPIPNGIPVRRPAAGEPGEWRHSGPTRADLVEIAGWKIAKVRGTTAGDVNLNTATSRDYETEWHRILQCGDIRGEEEEEDRLPTAHLWRKWSLGRVYERGMLTGLWQGYFYMPDEPALLSIARNRGMASNFGEVNMVLATRPLFVRLEEHGYVRGPGLVEAAAAGSLEGLVKRSTARGMKKWKANAKGKRTKRGYRLYLAPRDSEYHAQSQSDEESVQGSMDLDLDEIFTAHELESDLDSGSQSEVEGSSMDSDSESAYSVPRPSSEEQRKREEAVRKRRPCTDGVEDVIVTGLTDLSHSLAWGPYVFYGRVRPWDGLVGLLRMSVAVPPPRDGERGLDKMFFYGYVHAGRSIVGNWRYVGVDAWAPTMESSFVVSKREE